VPTFRHMKMTPEMIHRLATGEIQHFSIDPDIDPDPVGSVQYFGEMLRISDLPPAYPRFIRIKDTAYITTLKGISGVRFFKIGSLAHGTVSEAKQTFRGQNASRIKSFFHDRPGVRLYIILI